MLSGALGAHKNPPRCAAGNRRIIRHSVAGCPAGRHCRVSRRTAGWHPPRPAGLPAGGNDPRRPALGVRKRR